MKKKKNEKTIKFKVGDILIPIKEVRSGTYDHSIGDHYLGIKAPYKVSKIKDKKVLLNEWTYAFKDELEKGCKLYDGDELELELFSTPSTLKEECSGSYTGQSVLISIFMLLGILMYGEISVTYGANSWFFWIGIASTLILTEVVSIYHIHKLKKLGKFTIKLGYSIQTKVISFFKSLCVVIWGLIFGRLTMENKSIMISIGIILGVFVTIYGFFALNHYIFKKILED